jgi:transitional endoplasmic reticulum ATPase
VDIKFLASSTDGLVGADIEAICRKASMSAIREFIETCPQPRSGNECQDYSGFTILDRHFKEALKERQ